MLNDIKQIKTCLHCDKASLISVQSDVCEPCLFGKKTKCYACEEYWHNDEISILGNQPYCLNCSQRIKEVENEPCPTTNLNEL